MVPESSQDPFGSEPRGAQVPPLIAASHIPLSLSAGWKCRSRRLSKARGNPDMRRELWPGRPAGRRRASVPAEPAHPTESSASPLPPSVSSFNSRSLGVYTEGKLGAKVESLPKGNSLRECGASQGRGVQQRAPLEHSPPKPRREHFKSMIQRAGLILTGIVVACAVVVSGVSAERHRPAMPKIAHPVLFGTPEADRILAALQVFPPDNPWNQDISAMPVHANSARIIASIGADKNLGYNLDMNFVIVPPDQQRIPVKILQYPA